MIGNKVMKAMTGPFLWYFVATKEPPTVEINWMRPYGALKRMAWKESKPNDLTRRGPKEATPPEGTLQEVR